MRHHTLDSNSANRVVLDDASSFLVSPRFLQTRLLVYAAVRFAVAGAIAAGAGFAPLVVGIENLPVTALYILAAVLLLYNAVLFVFVYRYPREPVCSHLYLVGLMHVSISLDFLFLTVALWLVGGAASPFASFYILHIILAAMLMPRMEAFFQALFGYALFAALVMMQLFDILPTYNPVGAVGESVSMDWRFAATLLTVQAILFIVTTLLVSEIAAALKRGERALSELNVELKQLSEMRRDFLHVVTHNLKAPAAAATMLLETVESLWSTNASNSAREAIKRARRRTQELGELVQDLQQLSALESGALHGQEQHFSLNDTARKLAEEYGESAALKKQQVELLLEEGLPEVHAVPRLILEAAANYVTNAIKYTPEGGHIILRTFSEAGQVVFEVEDTGVGIPKECLSNLFGEFVRAPAQVSGERPPGIGLGLSIVKRILQYYDGRVYVSSTLSKGSVFGFTLPIPGVSAVKPAE